MLWCVSTQQFVEIIKALVSCVGAFGLDYTVKLVDGRLKVIVDDTVLSEYLKSRVRATHEQYVWFAKPWIDNSKLIALLGRLTAKSGTGKNLGILRSDRLLL